MKHIYPMFRNKMPARVASQKGSMIVIAVFVIVVMSLLGLALTQILSAQSDSVIHEVHGVKALNAAQTGLQVKVAEAFPVSGTPRCDGAGESPLNLNLSGVTGMENCSAQVTCSLTSYAGGTIDYYRFYSVGTCQAGDIITSRELAVDAKVE